jgi:hypothetical protein
VRRVLLALIALSALALAAQRAWVALASQTTRIRWRLEEMESGFNAAELGPCMRGIAVAWRDEERGIDRAELADGLRALFFQEVDPQSHAFRYRVGIDRESIAIELDPTHEGIARVALVALFELLERGAWSPTWRVRIEAELARDPQLGWQVTHSRPTTLESDGRLVRELGG